MPAARQNPETTLATNETKRTRFLKVRCTRDEHEEVRQRASQAGMNLSDYLRHAAFHQKIIAQDAFAMLGELRRIGALIKHCYPSIQNWTPEEKRRYWDTREQLLTCAENIACTLGIQKSDQTDRKLP
jgi:hypothetical protein